MGSTASCSSRRRMLLVIFATRSIRLPSTRSGLTAEGSHQSALRRPQGALCRDQPRLRRYPGARDRSDTPWRALETATTSLVERSNDRVGRDHQYKSYGYDNWRNKPSLHRKPFSMRVKCHRWPQTRQLPAAKAVTSDPCRLAIKPFAVSTATEASRQ